MPPNGLDEASAESFPASDPVAVTTAHPEEDQPHSAIQPNGDRPLKPTPVKLEDGTSFDLDHGAVVIAAITSCTNTSNPSVMIGAGAARQEGGRGRARTQAVGQDLAGAGFEGRHRLLRPRPG